MAPCNALIARDNLAVELYRHFGESGYFLHGRQRIWRFSVGLTKDKQSGNVKLAVMVVLTDSEWANKDSLTINDKPYTEFVKPIPTEFAGYGVDIVQMAPAEMHQAKAPKCGDICELP